MIDFEIKINKYFEKKKQEILPNHPFQLLIYSKEKNIDTNLSNLKKDTPFHIASIGKVFTACLIGKLINNKKINLQTKVKDLLNPELLTDLFKFKEIDYKNFITIEDLLSHTSGINDYFESDSSANSKFIINLIKEPFKIWDKYSLLDYTRYNLKPISKPGKFSYSDTGYILLGLIIENLYDQDLSEILKEEIFQPLEMNNSWLLYDTIRILPQKEIAKVFFNNYEISETNMLSCDWAGGGIVSTTEDLLKFQNAFHENKIVDENFKEEMMEFKNRYLRGIHYGKGLMELHFNEFFFLLFGFPKMVGHTGILSTQMYYDRETKTSIILNLGDNLLVEKSFRMIIDLLIILKRLK